MSSLTRPFELANVTGYGIRTSEQSISYAAQARNLVKADSEAHLSIDRTRSSYNAIGIRHLASGTPAGPAICFSASSKALWYWFS
ncbi:uncharacterized protein N7503_011062 [Penicillium pulvis]|uniref:uncharacterized protein n=1 Tax=Penicillium pulvis TaxID=1562058 RepID=UPI0025492090|nr:uncharacterized protein N7503_011062 [Penicillium pulvis]KAJ5785850.1 hypothetical protein N7503_011062 [Penicillium pulvis]